MTCLEGVNSCNTCIICISLSANREKIFNKNSTRYINLRHFRIQKESNEIGEILIYPTGEGILNTFGQAFNFFFVDQEREVKDMNFL